MNALIGSCNKPNSMPEKIWEAAINYTQTSQCTTECGLTLQGSEVTLCYMTSFEAPLQEIS